jgi:catechol 2,3-dioxygenase-like lactoylglutathione lyase family enzyme
MSGMNSTVIHHFEYNVSDLKKSRKFYDRFLAPLGWRRFMTHADVVGYTDGLVKLFLVQVERRFAARKFHRKQIGLNHIAFRVGSKSKVDDFYAFLKKNKAAVLYGGPKDYSAEYAKGYYAVFFEDPDRIKLEVVFAPEARGAVA